MPTLQQNTAVETIAILQTKAIVIYKSYPRRAREQTEAEKENLQKGKNGQYNGYLSPATARKIKGFLGSWLTALDENIQRLESGTRIKNKYFPTFVTLTLPAEQMHDDNYIKRKLLDRFIQQAKRKFGVQHYFWRAEPQKNGNIHFHILLDKFVPWQKLRKEWNYILADHGYIELYRQNQTNWHKSGFRVRPELLGKWSLERQQEAYNEGIASNWSNPNTTDIHQIRKVKNLAAYITKYVTKTETTGRSIKGRIWGASDGVRALKVFRSTVSVSESFCEFGNPTTVDYIEQCEKLAKPEDIIEDEFIKVIRLKQPQNELLKKFSRELYNEYKAYYKTILSDLYALPIFNQKASPAMIEAPF